MTEPKGIGEKAREELEPEWSEMRAQRVLRRVQDEVAADAARERSARGGSRGRIVAAVGVGLAAAAAIGLALYLRDEDGGARRATTTGPTEERPGSPSVPEGDEGASPRLGFGDGSFAELSADADVDIETREPTRIVVVQRAGSVRYRVTRAPERAFVVRALPVTVEVRGTEFVVEMRPEWVEVRVSHGIVDVDDGHQVTRLLADEIRRVRIEVAQETDRAGGESSGEATTPSAAEAGQAVASAATRERPPETPRAARPGIDALLAEADAARAEGRLDDASRALASIAAEFPRDDRAPSALFTLGRIERRRGRPLDAAEAFSRCAELAPRGPLAEDALAEAARAYADGGEAERARALAARYLEAHPEGTYAARMRALLGR